MTQRAVENAFPELDAIENDALRAGVIDVWTLAIDENHVADLGDVPWLPPTQRELDLDDAFLVDHVRDVTALAVSLAETLLERRDVDLSLDTVIAGALVHDVSKLAEFDGMDATPVYDVLGHPYYGVYFVARADLPVEISHIVLSHSHRTNVEPATIEAEIVRQADAVAAQAIRWRATDDLRTV